MSSQLHAQKEEWTHNGSVTISCAQSSYMCDLRCQRLSIKQNVQIWSCFDNTTPWNASFRAAAGINLQVLHCKSTANDPWLILLSKWRELNPSFLTDFTLRAQSTAELPVCKQQCPAQAVRSRGCSPTSPVSPWPATHPGTMGQAARSPWGCIPIPS